MQRFFNARTSGCSLWPLIVMVLICTILLASVAFLLSKTDLSTKVHQPAKSLLTESQLSLGTLIQKDERPQAVARRYMTALLKGQYSTMWSLLSPQMQAKWSGESGFASFWQARYRDYILQSFSIGSVSTLSHWVDPETMAVYSQVEEMHVSLQLRPDQALMQEGQLPPEDLHPEQVLKNLPFIVEQVSNPQARQPQWVVLAANLVK
jgi:hypothetical protein